jgi:hypothetical protein
LELSDILQKQQLLYITLLCSKPFSTPVLSELP